MINLTRLPIRISKGNTLIYFSFCLFFIVTSCESTPTEKLVSAQETAKQANTELEKAKVDYLNEIDNYRKDANAKIAANDKSIAEFKARVANEKQDAKAEYKMKIAELDLKNSDMKKQINDYKADTKDKWELFKINFNKSMNDLGDSFKKLAATK